MFWALRRISRYGIRIPGLLSPSFLKETESIQIFHPSTITSPPKVHVVCAWCVQLQLHFCDNVFKILQTFWSSAEKVSMTRKCHNSTHNTGRIRHETQTQSKVISFLAHQIEISVVFTHVRLCYLAYPFQPVGKIKNKTKTAACRPTLSARRSVMSL